MKRLFIYLFQHYGPWRLGLLLGGLFLFALASYSLPIFTSNTQSFNQKDAYTLSFIFLIIGLMGIYGSTMVETSLRLTFVKMIIKGLVKHEISNANLSAFESVHVNGLIEKLVWSLTDFVKFVLSIGIAFLALSISSVINFFIILSLTLGVIFLLYRTRGYAFTVRRKLAQASRIVVLAFHNPLGLFIVFSSPIVMEKRHRLADAFVVFQGECVHFYEVTKILSKK